MVGLFATNKMVVNCGKQEADDAEVKLRYRDDDITYCVA
jgi:hypothetical protein